MITRRRLLAGVGLGGIAAGLNIATAAAFSIEPMTKPVAQAYALACKPLSAGGSDHGALIGDAQATLKREIASGALPADAREVVVCPICGCRFIVTADTSY